MGLQQIVAQKHNLWLKRTTHKSLQNSFVVYKKIANNYDPLYYSMKEKTSFRMGSDRTAKHFGALGNILHAAGETDFYLRQNQCVAIVIPEVGDK